MRRQSVETRDNFLPIFTSSLFCTPPPSTHTLHATVNRYFISTLKERKKRDYFYTILFTVEENWMELNAKNISTAGILFTNRICVYSMYLRSAGLTSKRVASESGPYTLSVIDCCAVRASLGKVGIPMRKSTLIIPP